MRQNASLQNSNSNQTKIIIFIFCKNNSTTGISTTCNPDEINSGQHFVTLGKLLSSAVFRCHLLSCKGFVWYNFFHFFGIFCLFWYSEGSSNKFVKNSSNSIKEERWKCCSYFFYLIFIYFFAYLAQAWCCLHLLTLV